MGDTISGTGEGREREGEEVHTKKKDGIQLLNKPTTVETVNTAIVLFILHVSALTHHLVKTTQKWPVNRE
jgi:hypothetical protein